MLIHPPNRRNFIIALECLFFGLTFERIFATIKLSKRQKSGWMYHIEFYTAADGTSKLWDFLDSLQQKSIKSKDARDDWISRKG
jgi:hypothetical protein